jgi:hypothetical protein
MVARYGTAPGWRLAPPRRHRWRSAHYENPEFTELAARDNVGIDWSEGEVLQIRYLHFDLFIASIEDL